MRITIPGTHHLLALMAGLPLVACVAGEEPAPPANGAGSTTLSIADSSVLEGDVGPTIMTFTVTLSEHMSSDVSVDYTSNVVTADSFDFVVDSGSVTIVAGETQATLEVEIVGDTVYETDETLTVNLENLPAGVDPGDVEAFGTIRTDDLPPVVVLPAEILEGDTDPRILVIPVELAGITNDISVEYETSDITATVADDDYVESSGILDIPAGTVSASIEVEIVGDTRIELHEDLLVKLTAVAGDAMLVPGADSALGTILDNDRPIILEPTVSVPNAFGAEGDSGINEMLVHVTVNTPVASDIVIDYATSDVGSAEAGVDYDATSGRLRIPAGATSASIPVDLHGDTDVEGLEYFMMSLTLITKNVLLRTPRALCTIAADDHVGPPFLSVLPGAIFEGDSGSRDMELNIAMTSAAINVVAVDYSTVDVTALAGSDYESTSGSFIFAVGETVKTIRVPVHGDTVIEADEIFAVRLTSMTGSAVLFESLSEGLIQSDDPFALLRIDDVAQLEGDSGGRDMLFRVFVDAVAGDPVEFDFASADHIVTNPATAGDDYAPVSGRLSIPAGDTEITIAVAIEGDTDSEFDETFALSLANVTQNAQIADDLAVGKIVNDETTPGWGVPEALSQGDRDNVLPQVRMNADGDAMAVWSARLIGEVESSRYSAGGWQGYEVVASNSARDRDLFVDGAGQSSLGWIFGVAKVSQHMPGSGWSPEHEFDPQSIRNQDNVRLAGNEAGSVLALWVIQRPGTSSHADLMYSAYDPMLDEWSDDEPLALNSPALGTPAIAMNERGVAIAVWPESGVRASRWDPAAGTWSDPLPISNELAPGILSWGYQPDVAVDPSGNAIAVWDDRLGVGTSVRGSVWASHYDADDDQWSEPFQIELASVDATNAQVAMDGVGNAFVVWLQDNNARDGWNDSFEIWTRRYDAATDVWEPELLLHDPDMRVSQFGFQIHRPLDDPALAVGPDGDAIVAWSEKIEGTFMIRASRFDIDAPSPSWGPPERISDATWPFAIFPDIAMDAAGNAAVVWQAGDIERFGNTDTGEIWSNRYTR